MSARTATTESAAEFLARVLGAPELAREYPLGFDADCAGEIVTLEEEGGVRAACTVLVRDFLVGGRTLRGGLIGSVATDPAFRGRGFGTRLLQRAERTLAERGCLFALLWADDPGFYLRRGYAPFGSEHDVMLVPELAPLLPEPTGVRELCPGDAPFVQRRYEQHPTRVARTLAETRALLGVPGMLTLVRERAAAPTHPVLPVAYACLGRGRDLADVVHEWGGEPTDVLALLRAHLERRAGAALFLMTPPSATELAFRLAELGAPAQRGILGLAKLLDERAAGELLTTVLGASAKVEHAEGKLVLRGPRGTTELEPDALHAVLFGSPETHAEVRALLARLGFEGARLPLEPFAFGLDSI